ncbi:hypothetical protein WN944_007328 [Citrus x changshan-huyou]|uniref:Peptidase A1 domain-containing protein n=1 Tax=Citrus x changshan-huyou TaxID=2935761 RepID=A0AAP0QQB8_9ROSI
MSMKFLGIQIAVAFTFTFSPCPAKLMALELSSPQEPPLIRLCFPIPKDLSPEEIHHRIAQLSRARAIHLRSNQEPETLKAPVPPSPFANTNIYITKISIGSAQFSPYLIVDTGSDDTWLQCLCSYDWKYKKGSGTKGVLSSESFTFPGDKNTSLTFANVTFGCGYDNQNVSFGGYMGSDNIIAVVFGLGEGQLSILRQLEPETNLRFSYCLRLYPTTDGSNTTYLRFGPDAQIKGDNKRKVQTIKLNPSLPGYFVNVTGISVEGKRLEIDPALFQLKQGGSGGFAIDSGVGPTLLVPEAYEVLKLEILEFYLARGFHPVKVLHVPYDLCYAITPAANADASGFFPSMVIHFERADLFLDDTAVMGFVASQLFCLIFLPTHPSGPNLLGAFQQENQSLKAEMIKDVVIQNGWHLVEAENSKKIPYDFCFWVTPTGINDSKPLMTIHFEEADLVLEPNAVSQKVGDPL